MRAKAPVEANKNASAISGRFESSFLMFLGLNFKPIRI